MEINPLQQSVFLVIKDHQTKLFAATTRPDSSAIGLPGGKIEHGESLLDAAMREAHEEGWLVELRDASFSIMQTIVDDGKVFHWIKPNVRRIDVLPDYKEKGRIKPLWATVEEVAAFGKGNQFLLSKSV